jgi:hypothetical protein
MFLCFLLRLAILSLIRSRLISAALQQRRKRLKLQIESLEQRTFAFKGDGGENDILAPTRHPN